MNARNSIVVADHHPLFRSQCAELIESELTHLDTCQANSVVDAIEILSNNSMVELVLLGLSLTDTKNFSGLKRIKDQFPDVPIAVVSSKHHPEIIRNSLLLGASGFIPKTLEAEKFKQVIMTLLAGKIWAPEATYLDRYLSLEKANTRRESISQFTPAQTRVLKKLNEGLLNKQIAYDLQIAECTVKAHMSSIMKKLGATSRTQVVTATSHLY